MRSSLNTATDTERHVVDMDDGYIYLQRSRNLPAKTNPYYRFSRTAILKHRSSLRLRGNTETTEGAVRTTKKTISTQVTGQESGQILTTIGSFATCGVDYASAGSMSMINRYSREIEMKDVLVL